ncbi:hypothetical protein H7J86_18550 [Mycobacterium hackensackense]|uniref:hypothetical protein n=1 Tax=Mycobacterium hackensackense TaxID=228909 RepID=UPI002265DC10|nr:hypothetical protein [Mycobacterium hackensackense]MCV7254165.1 hypothetical protein [Mycobacterium hackensackense]
MQIDFPSLGNEAYEFDLEHLADAPAVARDHIAEATGEATSDIALAIQWAVAPPSRLRNVHAQLRLRHYSVGSIEWADSGVWRFEIEGGPGLDGARAAGVIVGDVGEDGPDRDLWAPQHVQWATNLTNYTGNGMYSPPELADRILTTIATDHGGD